MTRRSARDAKRGQALVEFALAFTLFALLIMALFDFGRAIYLYNGVSQAAREIARTTSVHPGATLGSSLETASTVSAQRSIVPGMSTPTFACVDVDGSAVASACRSGYSVKVTVSATYQAVTPILNMLGTINLTSTSTIELQ